MSDVSLSELKGAELVPDMESNNAYLVRLTDGSLEMVDKNARNTLVLKDDVLSDGAVTVGDVTASIELESGGVTLERDEVVEVPPAKTESALWAVYDRDVDRLEKLFEELWTPTVREGLMDQFMPRFRQNDEISKQDDGWFLEGEDILVSWDGENHPVGVSDTHVVRGGNAVPADGNKEAREIQFDLPGTDDSYEVVTPDGREMALRAVEMRFLTTVGLITGQNPQHYDDDLTAAVSDSRIEGFTDTKSGIFHNHNYSKHRIQDAGVTDKAADMLWSNSNDHSALHEILLRREEFEKSPFEVFENSPNTDESKWNHLERLKGKAPIPTNVRQKLKELYE